jgi:hypothetical protein
MKKKTVAVIISVALLAAAGLPLISYFQESNGNDNVVFEYNGKKVYETEVKPYVDYYMKINSVNDLETKNYAVDNYIRSLLLSEFSKDMGMTVNDNEIFDYINKSPIFQVDEKFSKQKYDEFIARLGVKPIVFENEVRKDLYVVDIMDKVDKLTNINDYYFDIIKETLAQQRVIEQLRINLNEIPVVINEDELKEMYESNKLNYTKTDQIVFAKHTYVHPLNQSEKDADMKIVKSDTKFFYDEISALRSQELSKKLVDDNISTSTMSLSAGDFSKIVGTNNSDNITKGTFLIDSEGLDNGVITVYEVTNVTKGTQMDYAEARPQIESEYKLNMKLKLALNSLTAEDGKDFSKVNNKYFSKYKEDTINPLNNTETEEFYNIIFGTQVGKFTLYHDKNRNEYSFIKVKAVEPISLTKEQEDYFRVSQNNMYKQFMLLSMYDGLKKQYDFKKYNDLKQPQ